MKPSSSDSPVSLWKAIAFLLLVILDMVFDMKAASQYMSWGWLLLTLLFFIIAFCVTYGQALISNLIDHGNAQTTATATEAVDEITSSILNRWNRTRGELGIDPDEERADIRNFPDVLMRLEELDAAREGTTDRAVRIELAQRFDGEVRLVLVPLATELAYIEANLSDEQVRTDGLDEDRFTAEARAELTAL